MTKFVEMPEITREGGCCSSIEKGKFASPRGASAQSVFLLCSYQIRCYVIAGGSLIPTCFYTSLRVTAIKDLSC